ncbi:MAG: undecaprenyldiphospho-muramoylpentapeptide beta-N-acetylglucosaminyltransferase [Spirochaetales bacterium]|nr:undecaprenyldiphospho-muramoylpentapeptide beta-N-acetylglucosaminyltransferase [Spirochaetales bacterium]
MRIRIAFTGGGTAGHVFPGIAVCRTLREKTDAEIFWIGSRAGMEKRLAAAAGIAYRGIPAGKLRRYPSLKNLFDVWRVLAGFFRSFFVLISLRPSLLFSKGGYVSVPPVLAARLLGIPIITHESDFDPGLATRINARCAEKILLSYPETARYFSSRLRAKVVVTGNPVRAAILSGDAARGRELVGCPAVLPLVLTLGGSLGSAAVNDLVSSIAQRLCRRAFLVHQTGRAGDSTAGLPHDRYFARPFFSEELPHLLAAAALVISRAGANTLWELAAAGKPSILIPLPEKKSRGDQIRNARVFEDAGAAVVLDEEKVRPADLLAIVEKLLDNNDSLRRMADEARRLFVSDSSERIADEILALLPRRAQ